MCHAYEKQKQTKQTNKKQLYIPIGKKHIFEEQEPPSEQASDMGGMLKLQNQEFKKNSD